jgi:septum formation protein
MAKQPPFRLILASGSPARRDLLTRAGYRFETIPAHIDEPSGAGFSDPRTLVQYVAWLKAAAVARNLSSGIFADPTVILAADTVGWLNGQAIGKPADAADARRILRILSGTEHELWTGVCLWRLPDNLQVSWQEMSRVRMKPMSETGLDSYLQTRVWEGCSGAYAIQEEGDPYVSIEQGSMSNVIGLPMETCSMVLRWFVGIQPPDSADSA